MAMSSRKWSRFAEEEEEEDLRCSTEETGREVVPISIQKLRAALEKQHVAKIFYRRTQQQKRVDPKLLRAPSQAANQARSPSPTKKSRREKQETCPETTETALRRPEFPAVDDDETTDKLNRLTQMACSLEEFRRDRAERRRRYAKYYDDDETAKTVGHHETAGHHESAST